MTNQNEKEKIKVAPGFVIHRKRELLGWRGVELAKRAGINPRTLEAIEKGRIKSPSIESLIAIANALEVSVASLFVGESTETGCLFLRGDQKGQVTLEFPKAGFRIVCYTPMVRNLFAGKVILKGETRIEHKILPIAGMIFVQAIMGKLSVQFDGKDHWVREGNYAFFDGCFPHSFYNPQFKESTFLLVTTPSFLSSNSRP